MSSMGMDKSGSQSIAQNTWVKLVSFTVRSGYPSTVITGDALVMNAAAVGNFTWRGQFTGVAGTQQFRIVRNGTTVIGAAVNQQVVGTATGVSVSNGDTIELQAFTQFSGGFASVTGGAAATYVYFDQTTSNYNLDATQTVAFGRTAELALNSPIAVGGVISFDRTAGLSLGGPVTADQTVAFGRTAELYQGIHYTGDATQTIGFDRTADLLWTPAGAAPPALGGIPDTNISIHTADGVEIGVFPCTTQQSVKWMREGNEVSGAEFTVHTQPNLELCEELRQWAHWATIWEDDVPVWTGPLKTIRVGRSRTEVTCRDPAWFMWRTRVPTTRTWVDTAPARVADGLWQAMFQLHGIAATPRVLDGSVSDTFTLSAKADSRMLHQTMNDLVKVGLNWTVVAGRPVLGTFPIDPVAELAECDFMVELDRVRDGSQMYNDIRVQGQNWARNAIADLAGLHLQHLVSLDDLFGVSNIERAAQQYARELATFRDTIEVPAGATLNPEAPVTLDDLVPGKVLLIHAGNVIQPMRLDQLTVSTTPETREVQVTLVAVENTGEIATLTGGGSTL